MLFSSLTALLDGAAAVGFDDRLVHRFRDIVGVHDDMAVDIAGCPADDLDQRGGRTQETFLVGVEDRDQGDLRQIEAFAQQVDADQDVELALAKVAQDFHPLNRFDIGMQVLDPQALFLEEAGQVFGHFLGQGQDQRTLTAGIVVADLGQQVFDLALNRPDG